MNSTQGCQSIACRSRGQGDQHRRVYRAGCTEGQDELGDKGVEGGAWQTGSACEKRAKTFGSHLEVPSGDPKAPQKLQVEPKSGPVGPQSSQEAPSWVQEAPKSRQVEPKRHPRAAKLAPRGAQDAPRGVQDAPRGAQDAPRAAQDAPRGAQEAPSWAPKTSKRGPSAPSSQTKRNSTANGATL